MFSGFYSKYADLLKEYTKKAENLLSEVEATFGSYELKIEDGYDDNFHFTIYNVTVNGLEGSDLDYEGDGPLIECAEKVLSIRKDNPEMELEEIVEKVENILECAYIAEEFTGAIILGNKNTGKSASELVTLLMTATTDIPEEIIKVLKHL